MARLADGGGLFGRSARLSKSERLRWSAGSEETTTAHDRREGWVQMRRLRLPHHWPVDMTHEAAWLARCVGRGEWAPLSQADIVDLGGRMDRVDLEAGAPLFQQGEASRGVWILREGRVELAHREGHRRVIVAIMHPGDVDGDISIILGMSLAYSGHAIEPVQALRLSAENFEELLLGSPALARRWLSSVAFRLAHAHRRVLQLSGRNLTQQLAGLLLDEERDGEVALPQESLAALLGVRRPSINKVLRLLERRNLVRTSYGKVELLEPDSLQVIAGRPRAETSSFVERR
jgi:CRP/FNR family transcriptional regulator, cAMP and macrophage regulator